MGFPKDWFKDVRPLALGAGENCAQILVVCRGEIVTSVAKSNYRCFGFPFAKLRVSVRMTIFSNLLNALFRSNAFSATRH